MFFWLQTSCRQKASMISFLNVQFVKREADISDLSGVTLHSFSKHGDKRGTLMWHVVRAFSEQGSERSRLMTVLALNRHR